VSGKDKWFPYDVSCNLIRNADHTRIHNDCEPEEDEWTFLIYLNPNMTKNDYGETVFYEQDTKNPEIVAEIRPKYGRAVIFQGL
jgi:Rps23 Pro-64 3,4-dihydroxylase Tpa1-like proline 4-hydroxylase